MFFFGFVIRNYNVFYTVVLRVILYILFCVLQVFLILCWSKCGQRKTKRGTHSTPLGSYLHSANIACVFSGWSLMNFAKALIASHSPSDALKERIFLSVPSTALGRLPAPARLPPQVFFLFHAYSSPLIFQIRYPATIVQVRYSNTEGSAFQLLITSRTTSPQ